MEYLSVSQIASLTGRHEETIRRWIREGVFTETKKGLNNMTLVRKDEVLSYISDEPIHNESIINKIKGLKVIDSPNWDLTVGQLLTFDQLKKVTNCPTIRGIRYRANEPELSIITSTGSTSRHEDNPYEDRFELGSLLYTGEGRKGNQKLTSGNLRLYEAEISGQLVHVFQKLGVDQYIFLGMFQVISHHTEKQPDTSGEIRDVFIFELKPIVSKNSDDYENILQEPSNDKLLYNLQALQSQLKNEKISRETLENRYKRSRTLVNILKELYDYNCQLCSTDHLIPPIFMKNGKKYIEVHHIEGFGEVIGNAIDQERGDFVIDSIENVICVCVYHHKLIHHYYSKIHFNKSKKQFVSEDGSLTLPIHTCYEWHNIGN
ncbi:helix-turn-helix domain-containing protein [Peribacillus asahii]|uniref:helix-turn-helix domain-containing protein n=1 Tax=Peribacillus asahii TaxID=228899 RepID=UPI00207A0852|nr:helix-turn-helix domain-containing protein [Peribacillus asahii]USK71257.1 hypothetical protein LIS76_05700 [Peribacillus asahii]